MFETRTKALNREHCLPTQTGTAHANAIKNNQTIFSRAAATQRRGTELLEISRKNGRSSQIRG